jgi:DMSO/TMAO reductase YedYZ molybdopterin-dependent catalytic subunit
LEYGSEQVWAGAIGAHRKKDRRGWIMSVGMKGRDTEQADLRYNKLVVTGRVTRPLVLGMEELRAMDTEEIEDLFIICGDGDPKGSIRNCKGVLLENIIRMADVIKEEHNDTKKMFIVVSAHDGYKVVFSWQEIFNTAVGGGVMILLERDGKPLDGEQGQLELISAEDYFAGSRYVKGLKNIEVALAR